VAEQPTERLVVGLVRGIHGLRGAVRIEVLTDDATRFAVDAVVHPEGQPDALTVAWVQEDGPGILVRFREITDRPAADTLRDHYLEAEVPRDALPSGEFYWHQVVGSTVTTTDGRELGAVEDVFRAGGGEVFVVSGGAWGEVMVPAVSAVVREFAPAEGRIIVDADGLGLDDEPPVRRPRGRRTTKAARAGTLAPPPADDAAAADDAPAADPTPSEADGPEPA
jgi:16S rRNA processing protein RimM